MLETMRPSDWRKGVWLPAVAAAQLADPQPTPSGCRGCPLFVGASLEPPQVMAARSNFRVLKTQEQTARTLV